MTDARPASPSLLDPDACNIQELEPGATLMGDQAPIPPEVLAALPRVFLANVTWTECDSTDFHVPHDVSQRTAVASDEDTQQPETDASEPVACKRSSAAVLCQNETFNVWCIGRHGHDDDLECKACNTWRQWERMYRTPRDDAPKRHKATEADAAKADAADVLAREPSVSEGSTLAVAQDDDTETQVPDDAVVESQAA